MSDIFDAIDNALEAIVEVFRGEETQNDYTLAGPAK